MEVKQVQIIQANHAERLLRMERRQTEDAAIKSVWNPSPFPSVLGGTPQHDPVQMSNNQVFDDFDDEQGHNLLGSLHLDADEEPTRRGAASRANSVRFDETTLHSSNWGQNTRHSGEFGPTRPGSGLGGGHALMERSFSHKSDGRHSSAGHSVHSFHSVASGRTSSLGLDLLLGSSRDDDDDSSVDITGPPPGLLFLGSVPSIVRCWLTTQYAHDTLLYAVVCSGSQKSTVDYALLKELDLLKETHRNINGVLRITLPVYFAEATVAQSHSRSSSPSRQVPYTTVDFEVTGTDQSEAVENNKAICIFIGSDTLRTNSADLFLSQNRMTLLGNGDNRDRLSVPFVRPEDESTYKYITTVNIVPEKPKLNATAPEFVSSDSRAKSTTGPDRAETSVSHSEVEESDAQSSFSPMATPGYTTKPIGASLPSDSGSERQQKETAPTATETVGKENAGQTEETRRVSVGGIWGSWRQSTSAAAGGDASQRENGLSGYQPAGKSGRSMKVLKPQKSVSLSSSARAAAPTQERPASSRSSGEFNRRKSQGAASTPDQNGGSSTNTTTTAAAVAAAAAATPPTVRWENARRSVSSATPGAPSSASGVGVTTPASDSKPKAPATRANPVGGASAFSWMAGGGAAGGGGGGKPLEKAKTPATSA
ncbi:hypothetical protein VMCG_00770 [Cytospora schulzeri]|uniref:Ubiquitin carboxyl-terminal hydrolase 19 n=1 Tax=Cytospora schulzeri TaxID=448051 RepID=A0A423X9R0_9PEZI|nr:hypothetical protein VMCG_00770 [Valsa malicola]